jgi:hypothetical protein
VSISRNSKAVSNILLIILLLCALVFGGLLSYLWVMGNFYLEHERAIAIKEVVFPVDHADFFNITVINPSHSISAANIKEVYFTVNGDERIYNVTSTSPQLPLSIEQGTEETIICYRNWGSFAGKRITVHVLAVNGSGATYSVGTQFVKIRAEATFNATVSCKSFLVNVDNDSNSALNLTIAEIRVFQQVISNLSVNDEPVQLPMKLNRNESILFKCLWDWEISLGNVTVTVETVEGYEAEDITHAISEVLLFVTDAEFNETKTDEMVIKLTNKPESTNPVDVTKIVLEDENGGTFEINGSSTNPTFYPSYTLAPNSTVTFNHCIWNWTTYRDKNITVTAYTKQGYTSHPKTVKTPPRIVWKITSVNFNLTNTGYFSVDITNVPCSIDEINVTKIRFNENQTETAPKFAVLNRGDQARFNCTWNWTGYRGEDVTITAGTENGVSVSQSLTLPSVELKIDTCDFGESATGTKYYFNLTVSNSHISSRNVNITQIVVETENATYTIDGTLTSPTIEPGGYMLTVGANVTIYCPWNWNLHSGQTVKITAYTAEDIRVSLQTTAQSAP